MCWDISHLNSGGSKRSCAYPSCQPFTNRCTLYKGTRVAKAGVVESLMVAPVSESIQGIAPEVSSQKSIMLQEMVER